MSRMIIYRLVSFATNKLTTLQINDKKIGRGKYARIFIESLVNIIEHDVRANNLKK